MISTLVVLKIAGIVFLGLFFINAVCQFGDLRIRGFRFGDFALILLLGLGIVGASPKLKEFGRVIAEGMNLAEFQWTVYSRSAREQIESLRQDTQLLLQQVDKMKTGDFQRQMKYMVP